MFPELDDRIQDPQLERTALLLCCSFDDCTLPVTLERDDFTDNKHRDIFESIQAVWRERGSCSFIDLSLHLSTRPWFESAGGSWFLVGLMNVGAPNTYFPATERSVARGLRELRIRRYAREFSVTLSDAREMIGQFTRHAEKMASILPRSQRTTLDVLDALSDKPLPWIPTGFPVLDRFVNMRRGNLITVGARTGQGKTVMLCNIACNLARQGKTVTFLTKEMTEDELVPRFLLYLERKPVSEARKSVDRETLSRINVHRIKTIDDVERYASLTESDLVIVDYIQILETTGRHSDNRVSELEHITGRLKAVAMDTDKCLLAASQINRETEKMGREPTLADLRGSGSIEQDSNVVILLHNPSAGVANPDAPAPSRNMRSDVSRAARELEGNADMATLIIAKNRAGKTGRCQLKWQPNFCAFEDNSPPLIDHDLPF